MLANESANQDEDTEFWGWKVYFDTIKVFLQDLERKFGNCNLRYADYAVERLDTCMGSVHTLVEYLSNGLQDSLFTPQGSQYIMFYRGQLEELIACLQQIAH